MSEKKELTLLQSKFLDVLFDEAKGDIPTAMRLAGYTSFNSSSVLASLKDEIIERAKVLLAVNSPKAALAVIGMLGEDAIEPGAKIKLAAAKEVLDRVNIVKSEHTQIEVTHGIFYLPPKETIDITPNDRPRLQDN